MLRDLATVLTDLHSGMLGLAQAGTDLPGGVRIQHAEMTLPVDTNLVFRDGGCVLQADVCRNYADAAWRDAPTRLQLTWAEIPTAALPADGTEDAS